MVIALGALSNARHDLARVSDVREFPTSCHWSIGRQAIRSGLGYSLGFVRSILFVAVREIAEEYQS